jgi:hypothetical protein
MNRSPILLLVLTGYALAGMIMTTHEVCNEISPGTLKLGLDALHSSDENLYGNNGQIYKLDYVHGDRKLLDPNYDYHLEQYWILLSVDYQFSFPLGLGLELPLQSISEKTGYTYNSLAAEKEISGLGPGKPLIKLNTPFQLWYWFSLKPFFNLQLPLLSQGLKNAMNESISDIFFTPTTTYQFEPLHDNWNYELGFNMGLHPEKWRFKLWTKGGLRWGSEKSYELIYTDPYSGFQLPYEQKFSPGIYLELNCSPGFVWDENAQWESMLLTSLTKRIIIPEKTSYIILGTESDNQVSGGSIFSAGAGHIWRPDEYNQLGISFLYDIFVNAGDVVTGTGLNQSGYQPGGWSISLSYTLKPSFFSVPANNR